MKQDKSFMKGNEFLFGNELKDHIIDKQASKNNFIISIFCIQKTNNTFYFTLGCIVIAVVGAILFAYKKGYARKAQKVSSKGSKPKRGPAKTVKG